MPTIFPKSFAKLDFFGTMSLLCVAYSTLNIFSAFLTFSHLCLDYLLFKILENWKKIHKFLKVKDNLAVLL